MSVGFDVQRGDLDMKAADAVLSLRTAFDKVDILATWLANHPSDGTNDPLQAEPFNYNADEAYILRTFFETMQSVGTSNADTFAIGRKMTGLS